MHAYYYNLGGRMHQHKIATGKSNQVDHEQSCCTKCVAATGNCCFFARVIGGFVSVSDSIEDCGPLMRDKGYSYRLSVACSCISTSCAAIVCCLCHEDYRKSGHTRMI